MQLAPPGNSVIYGAGGQLSYTRSSNPITGQKWSFSKPQLTTAIKLMNPFKVMSVNIEGLTLTKETTLDNLIKKENIDILAV